jgi:hypothetical protein
MRESLRILGFAVLLGGGLTLLNLFLSESVDSASPALRDWAQSADIRRYMWIGAGALYLLGGLMLVFLRRWAAVAFVLGAILAAASMAYDMAAFTGVDLLAIERIRIDVISLVCALLLTAATVPLVRRRVLK